MESTLTSYKAIHDVLLRVSADTHETVLFSIWDGSNAVCIDKVTGTFYVSVVQVVNEITPVHAGATGFATLMTMKESDAKKSFVKTHLQHIRAIRQQLLKICYISIMKCTKMAT